MSMKKYFSWLRGLKLFRQVKLIIKRLQGRELWLRPELKVPLLSIGFGDFCPDGLDDSSVVYSLGVGEEIVFDLAFIDHFDADIHAFDPTPPSVAMIERMSLPENFKFHPWAVTAQDEVIRFYPKFRANGSLSTVQYTIIPEEGAQEHAVEVQGFTIKSIMRKLGHESIDLMKINIEGAEYDVFDSLLDSGIYPKQILVEFHHRFPNIGITKTEQILKRLGDSGYQIISVGISGCILSLLRTKN